MKTIKELKSAIENEKARGAWANAVKNDAYTLIEELGNNESDDYEFYGSPADRKALLNGAQDWKQYSWGGCALCYNADIAKHYCSPSELKKTDNGNRRPNAREEWLDVQARALYQAEQMILRLA